MADSPRTATTTSRAAPSTSDWSRPMNRPVANTTASPRLASQTIAAVSKPAIDVPMIAAAALAGPALGSHRNTESRAATWAGTKTGTCAITRSANRESGAKWGRASRASTTMRASSSLARQSSHSATCARSGATPNPASPSTSRSISLGSRCLWFTIPLVPGTGGGLPRFQDGGLPLWGARGRSFSRMLQRPAKLVPGAVDVGLDGAEGEIEGGGDLLVRPALDVSKQDARSVLGPEPGDGPLDRRSQLLGLHLLEGGLRRIGKLDGGGHHRIGGGGVRGAIHAHRIELAAAQMIDRDVVGDLEQPGRELELRAIAIEVREHLDEAVLGQVLRELPIAHHAEDQREHRALVPANQLTVRDVAALEREGDDIGIGEIREVECVRHRADWDRARRGSRGPHAKG